VRVLGRAAAVLAGVAAAVVVGMGPAWAHVTVNPSQAVQGGFAKLTFRVPNEKDNASTTRLEVVIPTDAPIAFVAVKPVPGWTATTETTKLAQPIKSDDGEVTEAVSKITWTASGADTAIKSGQFQEFDVSAGPLPKVDQIVFKALQTYSDGEIVRWIEPPTAGGPEPEHPAPVLKLSKAAADGDSHGAATSSTGPMTVTGKDTASASSGWGVGLGIGGLAVGLAALAVALIAWRKVAGSNIGGAGTG
jgi:periplasmic copper chaperone A